MTDHWFNAQPLACTECGHAPDHPSHHRQCPNGPWSGFGPGFAWCRLPAGHDTPCELEAWDGQVWSRKTKRHKWRVIEVVPRPPLSALWDSGTPANPT